MNNRPHSAAPVMRRCNSSIQPKSTYFIRDNDKTLPFFRDSKIESCSKIVLQNGVPYAIRFPVRNWKNLPMNNFKRNPVKRDLLKTIYMKDYCSKKYDCHVGMDNKPLRVYDPNSYRNRMPVNIACNCYKNTSHFQIGNNSLNNKKQWVSTNHDSYKRPKSCYITHPGILADMAKRQHKKLEAIN